MKKFFVIFISFVVLVFCVAVLSVNTNAEATLPTENLDVPDIVESEANSQNISNEPMENPVETVDYVKNLYENYGLITEDELNFIKENLHSEMTLDYLLTLFARVHYLDTTSNQSIEDVTFDTVRYCIDRGIFDDWLENYKVPLTRGAFAYLLTRTVDDLDFEDVPLLNEINIVDEGTIPDVDYSYFYKDAVYRCYEYGLMLGVDENYTFEHETPVTNYQVCVVLNRLMNPELRQTFIY